MWWGLYSLAPAARLIRNSSRKGAETQMRRVVIRAKFAPDTVACPLLNGV